MFSMCRLRPSMLCVNITSEKTCGYPTPISATTLHLLYVAIQQQQECTNSYDMKTIIPMLQAVFLCINSAAECLTSRKS